MKRLAKKNINTKEEYDRIFKVRQEKGVDEFDLRRWECLVRYFRGGRLIDLGCLDSHVPILAKTKYPRSEVWGIDIAEKSIKELEKKYPAIYYAVQDIYDTEFPTGYFSYSVAGEVIEHLEKPEKFLEEAMRITKPGGVFVLSTPLGETKAGEVDGERHLWSYNVEDMHTLLGKYGKVKIKILRSKYFPKYTYSFPTLVAWCFKK